MFSPELCMLQDTGSNPGISTTFEELKKNNSFLILSSICQQAIVTRPEFKRICAHQIYFHRQMDNCSQILISRFSRRFFYHMMSLIGLGLHLRCQKPLASSTLQFLAQISNQWFGTKRTFNFLLPAIFPIRASVNLIKGSKTKENFSYLHSFFFFMLLTGCLLLYHNRTVSFFLCSLKKVMKKTC